MGDTDETVTGSVGASSSSEGLPPGLLVALEVLEGPDKGARFEIRSARTLLGRKEADVKLTDPTVSGKHAALEYAGGKLFLTDNDSTNGTEINGEPVESAPVKNMDEIKLGDSKLLLSVIDDRYATFSPDTSDEDSSESRVSMKPMGEEEEEETTILHAPLPNPYIPENMNVVLEITEGPEKNKKYKVNCRSTIIGRGPRADFQVEDPTISKRHFQIEIHNKDKMTVKDLASSNGTRLNDRYISAVKLRHGDVIQAGNTKIRILIHVKR